MEWVTSLAHFCLYNLVIYSVGRGAIIHVHERGLSGYLYMAWIDSFHVFFCKYNLVIYSIERGAITCASGTGLSGYHLESVGR